MLPLVVALLFATEPGIVLLATRLRALKRWTRVQGEVTESAVVGDLDRAYSARITVRWQAGGSEYLKSFDNWGSDSCRAAFDNIIAHYPKGSTAPILYNPANPSRAYLDADNKLPFLLVPAIVIFVGLVIVAIGYSIRPA
jgi:Protein of unknown function (DUF3592)